jgi:hypothetical protein
MRPLGRFFGFISKGIIEGYIKTPASPAIKDGSFRDGNGEHFFQAHGLGAELDHVAMVKLWFAALILYGKRLPGLLIETMEFHHIGLSDQAESQ